MNYTPQKIDFIYKSEKQSREALVNMLASWESRMHNLEYSKKRELQSFIVIIDNQLDSSVDLINMLYSLLLEEKSIANNFREKNEKMKKFIRNQGFNPSDLNWVNLNEI